jgi:hypothetical protein
MAEPEVEAAWQAEFKRIHDTVLYTVISKIFLRALAR